MNMKKKNPDLHLIISFALEYEMNPSHYGRGT